MDGFAFDNVFIGQSKNKVLFEYFTNLSDPDSIQSDLFMDSLMSVASINAIDIQAINKSQFDINMNAEIANKSISGKINIVALKDIQNMNATLFIAIVEDLTVQYGNKTRGLQNVLKWDCPSATGTTIQTQWLQGQNLEVSYSRTLTNVYDPEKLKVIAFIQNDQTREVYQVNMSETSINTSSNQIKETPGENLAISVYPNPASDNITVSYGGILDLESVLQLVNVYGKVMGKETLQEGTSLIELSLHNMPAGIYFINISNRLGESKSNKFLFVR